MDLYQNNIYISGIYCSLKNCRNKVACVAGGMFLLQDYLNMRGKSMVALLCWTQVKITSPQASRGPLATKTIILVSV